MSHSNELDIRGEGLLPIRKSYFDLTEAAEVLGCTPKDIIHFAANGDASICIIAKGWLVDLYYRPDDEGLWKLLALPSGQPRKALGPVRLALDDVRLLEADGQATTRRFGALLDEPAPEGNYEYRLCDVANGQAQPDVRIADCELVVLAPELKAVKARLDAGQVNSIGAKDAPSTENPVSPDPDYVVPKRKAPDAFVNALVGLLVEISRRAESKGMLFDVNAMPGRKADLLTVACKFDQRLDIPEGTFKEYLSGLCKFVQGQKNSKFYADLFPEYKHDPK